MCVCVKKDVPEREKEEEGNVYISVLFSLLLPLFCCVKKVSISQFSNYGTVFDCYYFCDLLQTMCKRTFSRKCELRKTRIDSVREICLLIYLITGKVLLFIKYIVCFLIY